MERFLDAMKKALIRIMAVAIILSSSGMPSDAFAWGKKNNDIKLKTEITWSKEQKEVIDFFYNIIDLSNKKDLYSLKSLYSTTYISGDGLSKENIFNMINDTWKTFPDLIYTTNILKVDIQGDYASIESIDTAFTDKTNSSEFTNDCGSLISKSHGMLYLRKFGKGWKVLSDKVLSEETSIKYGSAKAIDLSLIVPSQISAGDEYTVSLNAAIPPGMVAVGSIVREPIVYPSVKTDDLFRQIVPETNLLERVLKANSENLNELATASVGFTESTEDKFGNPDVKLSGLAVITRRVNVIPKAAFNPDNYVKKIKMNGDPEEAINLNENSYELEEEN